MAVPERYIDKAVYQRAKKKTEETYKGRPSAYASAYLVKTYKEMGGRIKGQENDPGLKQWFQRENWVNLTPFAEGLGGKKEYKCGEKAPGQKAPSVCRPAAKANQFSKAQIKKAVELKAKGKVVQWGKL